MFELIKRYLPRLISQQSDNVVSLFKIGLTLVLLNPIEQSQIVIKELGRYTVIQIHKITNVVMVSVVVGITSMLSATLEEDLFFFGQLRLRTSSVLKSR